MTGQVSKTASADDVLDAIKGTRDSLSVSRAYGAAYNLDGVTVIPVARVSGGAGGGGGEGTDDDRSGGGFGTGFGLHVNPIGAYEIRDGQVVWRPAVDANRMIRGGQVLGGIVAVCITLVLLARVRSR